MFHPIATATFAAFVFATSAGAQFTFQGRIQYPTQGSRPQAVAVGDFDGVNGTDFAVTSSTSVGADVTDWIQIFRNTGTGMFSPSQTLFLGTDLGAGALVAGDFDGDGDTDLAVTLERADRIQV